MMTLQTSLYVQQLFDYETYTYSYLIVDQTSREGVLIDPVKEQVERDLKLLEELGIELKYILETHVHADHITGAEALRAATGAKTGTSAEAKVGCTDLALKDGNTLTFGKYDLQVLSTPGHTHGCMSFYVDGLVFTGDALFIRGCGRTDFQQGDASTLYDSITQKLFTLPEHTVVYPGHDYKGRSKSTIREEKQFNPRLGMGKSKEDFIEIMDNLNLPYPKKIDESLPANLQCGKEVIQESHAPQNDVALSREATWEHMKTLPSDEVIVDIRNPEEYKGGHIPGSHNIPMTQLAEKLADYKDYKTVYIYCRSGRRVFQSLEILSQFPQNYLAVTDWGFQQWAEAGNPIETTIL